MCEMYQGVPGGAGILYKFLDKHKSCFCDSEPGVKMESVLLALQVG